MWGCRARWSALRSLALEGTQPFAHRTLLALVIRLQFHSRQSTLSIEAGGRSSGLGRLVNPPPAPTSGEWVERGGGARLQLLLSVTDMMDQWINA